MNGGNGAKRARIMSVCQKYRKCPQCGLLLNMSDVHRRGHTCGYVFCRTCKTEHKEGAEDECFMAPITDKKKKKNENITEVMCLFF